MPSRRTILATGLSALAAPASAVAAVAAEGYAEALARAYGGPVDLQRTLSRLLEAADAAWRRADGLLRRQGLADGEVGERLRTLWRDPRFLYADDEAGRDRAVAEMNRRLSALKPRLAEAFGDLPIPPAAVRRMPAAEVAKGRGGYREPGTLTTQGAYYVDLAHIRDRPSWTLPTVAFHEVFPGHLLQLPLQGEAHPPPGRLRAAGAYFEVWGTYAEQLAADLGAYAGDPLGEVGYLHWRLFRLGRGVADTGLNAMGWSPAQAIAQMRDLQGFPAAFISFEADVDRMTAAPGKLAAEALGALDLADWRPKDRAKWPAFHRAVLADGPWPFGDLKRRVAALQPHPSSRP
jgi:uncharacterized protein (DUF885 family)